MVFSIDFDGTVVTHRHKGVGLSIGAEDVLKELIMNGHKLILFTMRSDRDEGLSDAIKWFREREIPLYGVQTNPDQKQWTDSPKVYSDFIIDDTAWGIPLVRESIISNRPFVNWMKLRRQFIEAGIIK